MKNNEDKINETELISNLNFKSNVLEFVVNKVEEPKQLNIMLKDIGYLDNKDEFINKITRCEVFDCTNYEIKNVIINNDNIELLYKLDYILQALSGKEFIYRVTGVCNCKLIIPLTLYSVLNSENNINILEYRDKINFLEIKYDDIECDCLYLEQ